jgi:hypothetical protein
MTTPGNSPQCSPWCRTDHGPGRDHQEVILMMNEGCVWLLSVVTGHGPVPPEMWLEIVPAATWFDAAAARTAAAGFRNLADMIERSFGPVPPGNGPEEGPTPEDMHGHAHAHADVRMPTRE